MRTPDAIPFGDLMAPVLQRPWKRTARSLPYRKTYVLKPGQRWADAPTTERQGQRVAIALGKWDDQAVLGMRWNGSKGSPIGTPQSRGLPTWFIVPKRLEDAVINTLSKDDQKMVRTLLEN